jgi:hypothetical protein
MFQRLLNLLPWTQKGGLDAELDQDCKVIDSQSEEIDALTVAVRLMHRRNEDNIRESERILAAVLATYNGRIKLDGNIIDAVINSAKKLEIRMSEAAEDGSRTLTLIEHDDDEPSEDKDEEPTDEQLDEIEMSRDMFLDDGDGDADEDLVPV